MNAKILRVIMSMYSPRIFFAVLFATIVLFGVGCIRQSGPPKSSEERSTKLEASSQPPSVEMTYENLPFPACPPASVIASICTPNLVAPHMLAQYVKEENYGEVMHNCLYKGEVILETDQARVPSAPGLSGLWIGITRLSDTEVFDGEVFDGMITGSDGKVLDRYVEKVLAPFFSDIGATPKERNEIGVRSLRGGATAGSQLRFVASSRQFRMEVVDGAGAMCSPPDLIPIGRLLDTAAGPARL